eukprot:scaffold54682_cov69-Cyclotella_meneghiniana.AAC.8
MPVARREKSDDCDWQAWTVMRQVDQYDWQLTIMQAADFFTTGIPWSLVVFWWASLVGETSEKTQDRSTHTYIMHHVMRLY